MAYYQLGNDLVLDGTTVLVTYSNPVAMAGFDTLIISGVLKRLTGGTVKITPQQANDRDNFRDIASSMETITAEGYYLGTKRTGIATAEVRLKYEFTGSALQIAILSAGIQLSKQG